MSMQTFLATTGHELARASQQASGEWQIEFFLAGQDVCCLAAHRTNPGLVYAGTQGNGVLRSNDGGRKWSVAGLEGQVVKALAVSPTLPGTVYAGTKPARLFVSH